MKRLVAALVVLGLSAPAALAEVRVASPDGKVTAVARDKVITVTDNGTQKTIMTIRAQGADITGMCYSPDGKALASLDKDGTLNLFEAASGKQISACRTGLAGGLSFSQDGRTLTIKGKKNTKKFDVATGKEVR